MLHRDPAAFARPRPPLSELAAAAGLQERDGEFAHDASIWAREQDVRRLSRLMSRLGPASRAAVEAYALLTEDVDDPAALREALDILEDPEILAAVVDELLGPDDDPGRVRDFVVLAERLITVGGRGVRGGVAAAVAALAAERDGRPLDAESHLRTAARLCEGWDFVEDRLAWYESDRGDAAAAFTRWSALGVPADHPDLAVLRPFATVTARELGRNEPCWCGSGRKFKQCHRGRAERPPLPERVDWLTRKAATYVTSARRPGPCAGPLPARPVSRSRRRHPRPARPRRRTGGGRAVRAVPRRPRSAAARGRAAARRGVDARGTHGLRGDGRRCRARRLRARSAHRRPARRP